MKIIQYTTVILILLSSVSISCAEKLYFVSSKKMGITNFDYSVKEIVRKERYSIIEIPDFNNRSAAASRWMMCAYIDLAIKRGFSFWAVFYPEELKDKLYIVFPDSEDKQDPIYQTLNLDSEKPIIADVMSYASFCGMKIK